MFDPFSPFGLLVISLVVWRISSLLVSEEGPFDVFARLRYKAGVRYTPASVPYADNMLGRLFLCVWCMSVWVAPVVVLIALLNTGWFADFILLALASSASAIVLERFARK